jgi:hypothetical protein
MDLTITIAEQALADPTPAAFLLDRLGGLVARQPAATAAWQRVLLARSTFSVFLDCCDLSLGPQARAILARGHAPAAAVAGQGTR